MANESRSNERLVRNVPLIISGKYAADLVNLSLSGICFEVTCRLDSEMLKIRVLLTPKQVLEIETKIEWSIPLKNNRFRYGGSFVKIRDVDSGCLVNFLTKSEVAGLNLIYNSRLYDLWKLYKRSGFIYLKKRKYIAPLLHEINRNWKKLYSKDVDIFKCVGFFEDDALKGAASVVQVYSRTWMFQQLAVKASPHKFLPKYIISRLYNDYLISNPKLEYLQQYYRPDNLWPNRTFGGFREAHKQANFCDFRLFHFYELDVPPAESQARCCDAKFTVITMDEATSADLDSIKRFLSAHSDDLFFQSIDLTFEQLTLEALNRRYGNFGLEREREVLILKSYEEPIALAFLEHTSLGVNLSGVLNSCRIFNILEVENEEVGKGLLLERIVSFYANKKYRKVVLMDASQDPKLLLDFGFKKTKTYVCFTVDRIGLPKYFNYMMSLYNFELRRGTRK